MLFPGLYSRRDSITIAGRDAVRLVAGVIPMLVIAGTIEGFFSPSGAPAMLKFGVGAALFALLLAWLFSGRTDEQIRSSTERDGESVTVRFENVPNLT